MRSHIEIMGSIVPATPLPYRHLHFLECTRMVRDIPGAGGKSRPPRQGSAHLHRRAGLGSSELFRIHLVVYKRANLDLVGTMGVSAVLDTFTLEVAAICDLFNHRGECLHSHGHPRHDSTTTELGRPLAIGISYRDGRGRFSGDWNDPGREIRRETGTSPRTRHQGFHEHAIGDPNRITVY